MRSMIYALCAWTLLLCAGCSDNPITSPTGTTYPISTRIDFSLVPGLSPTGLTLHMATENSYSHSDFILEYQESQTSSSIGLTIKDAYEPSSGTLSSPAPAKNDLYLGVLAAGTYSLAVTVNDVSQNMYLTVSDSSYAISNGAGSWTNITSPLVYRIPAYTIWGTFASGSPSANLIAHSFIDSLDTIGAAARLFTPGDYSYFRVDSAGHIVDNNVTSIFHSAFAMVYAGQLSKVQNLTAEYGSSYGSNITITVHAYDGEVFSSTISATGGVTKEREILSVRRR